MKSIIRDIASKVDPITRRLVTIQGDIAAHIGKALKAKGLSQKQLADIAGMKESRVSKILSGNENLTLKTIIRLESATGTILIESPVFRSHAGRDIPEVSQILITPEDQDETKSLSVSTSVELRAETDSMKLQKVTLYTMFVLAGARQRNSAGKA